MSQSCCLSATFAALLAGFSLVPATLLADPESPGASAASQAQVVKESPSPQPDPTPAQRDEQFKKLMTNVKLSGHFALDGAKDVKLEREEYAITGAMKPGTGDYWVLTSRIRYGDVDLTVPVPVQVKWSGDTPVLTVDSVKIPGLGTFSARVLLDGARYAGTWSHDLKGGHLFGAIERDVAAAK